MSIECDPTKYDYSTAPLICNTCFDVDKTPDSLFINIEGVTMGLATEGVDPDPPNGVWELNIVGACHFQKIIGAWTFDVVFNAVDTVVNVTSAGTDPGFGAMAPNPCKWFLLNSRVNPAAWDYVGGSATLIPYLDGGQFSIQELFSLINMGAGERVFCNPRPLDTGETSYIITDRSTNTNIGVLME